MAFFSPLTKTGTRNLKNVEIYRPHRSKPTKFISAIKLRNTSKILLINVNTERLGVQINTANGVQWQ